MSKLELKSLLEDADASTPSARIARLLSERGALTGARIASLTGLAKSTVSVALSELRKSEIIVDDIASRPKGGRVGRPGLCVTLNPRAGTCVGVLFGLQRIQLVIADVSHAILAEKKTYIDPDYSPAVAAGVVKVMIEDCCAELGISPDTILGVGIALAAPVNPLDGRVLRAGGVPTWTGVDIKTLFEPILGHRVIADNESNCSAIAEMMWGAARGHEDFLMFTIDVGVGGAIVNRGRVIQGIAGAAGEFGHMSLDPNGPLCRCGNRGCLEMSAGFRQPLAYASARFGRMMSCADVVALALDGDEGCRRLIVDSAEAAGRGLGVVGSVLNPGLIVVGGDLSRAGELFLGPLEASYDKHTLVKRAEVDPAVRTRIVASHFTDNVSCIGAAGLVLRASMRRSAERAW